MMLRRTMIVHAMSLAGILTAAQPIRGQIVVSGKLLYTMAGPVIKDGVVVIRDGKIAAVGPAEQVAIPSGYRVLEANVVAPGLIDAHSTVGLSGILNYQHDQDQLEHSAPIQPELRAIDAYNPHEALVEWVRGFGVTTIHTGHAPGELVSGQTMVVKTTGNTVEEAVVCETATVAATIGPQARKKGKAKSPGTRGKMMAMLRAEFIKAQEYARKRKTADEEKRPAVSLRLETLDRVLKGEIPLMVTANRAQDIASALRLAREFDFKLILDSAAESYLLIDEIAAAGVPSSCTPPCIVPRASRKT